MKKIDKTTKIYLLFVGALMLYFSILTLFNPQTIMEFINVKLDNINAKNSIRSFYGGVNFTFSIFLIYASFFSRKTGLLLTSIYGCGFILGRIYSIIIDGIPDSFIITCLLIETILTIFSLTLFYYLSKLR